MNSDNQSFVGCKTIWERQKINDSKSFLQEIAAVKKKSKMI